MYKIIGDKMSYDLLNEMIKYIEENLDQEIEYKKLCKIVGISEYSLQRIFIFLTGISISEYIRKRRLSKAYEELKTTDIKIIDLAIKYNYDSSISFARAFKKYFNITPTECRESKGEYKLFPIINFSNNNILVELNYEIKNIDDKVLYCFGVSAVEYQDLLYKIRELYNTLHSNGLYEKMSNNGLYGICIDDENSYNYYVGSDINFKGTKKITIPNGKYAIFNVGTDEQKDIVNTYNLICNEWLKSTNYKILDKPEIELYDDNNCYIYIPIKDKQN